jgi:asparagine synthase (glutamine-hydrolysing)
MTARLEHRGPDDAGLWLDAAAGIGIGHRRLSILELSPLGHQPMVSACGRYVLAFNGEIYNYRTLRAELGEQAYPWRGQSDTEVLLASIALKGLPATLPLLNGMFALACWDRQTRCLLLARDRLGEKPLYYGWQQGHFLFGAELKAMTAHPEWRGELNRGALAAFLRLAYVPAPHSIYTGIHKLQPGTLLTLSAGRMEPSIEPYWSARTAVEQGLARPFPGTEEDAVERLEELLADAVALRMRSDVPLGAFLSGGIDSSSIVALMQAQSSRPVRTFTIGFAEVGYNEADDARRVAAHLGTEHTELYVTPADALAVVPRLPQIWDEPFADPSQVPTLLLSTLARRDVTVCLSGDGGDELFGGYSRYLWTRDSWQRLRWAPLALRRILARGVGAVRPAIWSRLLAPFGDLLPGPLRVANTGDRLHKAIDVLTGDSPEALFLRLSSHWTSPSTAVIGATEPATALTDPTRRARTPGITEAMMYVDSVLYLPDNILVKLDRASMGVSLEARVPLLDHRIFEFAWTLPTRWKVRGRVGKRPLRRIVGKHVPPALLDRPKMGFGVPLEEWLRGPLKDWAEALIARERLVREGFLHADPVHTKWVEHQSGRRNWSYCLWNILMFQAWLEGLQDPPTTGAAP